MSRAVTTDWMLQELAVKYEQIIVDFTEGENIKDEFRSINPMCKLPTLVDGDVVVTETAAICAYLADKYPEKGLAAGSGDRGQYYRYLFFPGTTLEPMFTLNELKDIDISAQSAGWGDFDRCMATAESMTPHDSWALGDRFTAADIVFGGTLDFACQFNWLKNPSKKIQAYIQRIKGREAYMNSHDSSWH